MQKTAWFFSLVQTAAALQQPAVGGKTWRPVQSRLLCCLRSHGSSVITALCRATRHIDTNDFWLGKEIRPEGGAGAPGRKDNFRPISHPPLCAARKTPSNDVFGGNKWRFHLKSAPVIEPTGCFKGFFCPLFHCDVKIYCASASYEIYSCQVDQICLYTQVLV